MYLSFIIRLFFTIYRYTLSPTFAALGVRCRFEPSCSAYAEEALKRYGPFYGLYLTLHRLLRCQPSFSSGYDPVPFQKKELLKGTKERGDQSG